LGTVLAVPPNVEVRRSARRRRTVSAYRDGDKTVVLVPSRLSKAEEEQWVATILERLAERERRRRPSDEALLERAHELSRRHLGGRPDPSSVRWVENQRTRWGSCTPDDATIRLSTRLRGMPPWVVDYVLVHELAHLLEPGHGPRFWELVAGYPKAERARGYLEGVAAAAHLPFEDDEFPASGEGEPPCSNGVAEAAG
jgi:predicted metal-dependent hydrolase